MKKKLVQLTVVCGLIVTMNSVEATINRLEKNSDIHDVQTEEIVQNVVFENVAEKTQEEMTEPEVEEVEVVEEATVVEETPAAKPEVKPATKPAVEETPAVKPAVKPTAKPEVKPVAKPAPKPTAKPEVKPAPKPTVEETPAPKPAVEETPAAKPAVKPAVEETPTAKPEVKPAPKPEPEPQPKPVDNNCSIIGGLRSKIVATSASSYSNENILWKYTPLPNYYAAERMSPVGQKVAQLRVGHVVTIKGRKYRVAERKTGLTYYDNQEFLDYLASSHYDIAIQTCDNVATYIIVYKLLAI